MSRELQFLLLGLAVGASLAGGLVWLLREPHARSFDECVLENVKAGMSDQAAALVVFSCRNLFPAPPTPSATAPAATVVSPDAAIDPAASGPPLQVELDFTQECWVELVIDGWRRISELHGPGESLQVDAEQSVVLANIGNAAGVEVQVNGKPFPLPADGRVVHNVRIELPPAGP